VTLEARPFFRPRTLFLHKHSPLVFALFQMAGNGWVNGICHAEPGLPKLLLLSLERVGVMEPPEYAYREYISGGTLRCDMMVFVEKSTRYPVWTLGSSPQLASASLTPTERPPVKRCDVYVCSTGTTFCGLLWDFSHPLKKEDALGLPG
jgi:hypothetical protein